MPRFPKKEVEIQALAVEIAIGLWNDVATAILTEATLVEQPEKTELEYRVIAVNKAGEGNLTSWYSRFTL